MHESRAVEGGEWTATTAAQIEVFMEQQSVICAKGYWCTAGNAIPCGENTYNPGSGEPNEPDTSGMPEFG